MKSKATGFTLIEVLVAMTIVAIAFLAILKVNNDNMGQMIHLENRTVAHWVGLQVINSLKAGTLSVANTAGKLEQTTTMLGKNWQWALQLSDTKNPGIKQITVVVYLQHDEKTSAQLIGYYSPPKPEPINAN